MLARLQCHHSRLSTLSLELYTANITFYRLAYSYRYKGLV